jgi:hypothetical protein
MKPIHIPKSQKKLAYLAAIIDGEGSIGFIINKKRRREKVAPRVRVTNTDLKLINWLKREFGGYIGCVNRLETEYKPCYEWIITGEQNIKPLLHAILPYLIIKRENAEEILRFYEEMSNKAEVRFPRNIPQNRLHIHSHTKILHKGLIVGQRTTDLKIKMGHADVAKFIPSNMRARIVQDLIAEVGIRPLSNAIGVNSKTVYKYKHGTARPTDEKMAKILVIIQEKHPKLFEKYINELRENFLAAVGLPPTSRVAFPEPEITPKVAREPQKKPEKKPRKGILKFLRLRR